MEIEVRCREGMEERKRGERRNKRGKISIWTDERRQEVDVARQKEREEGIEHDQRKREREVMCTSLWINKISRNKCLQKLIFRKLKYGHKVHIICGIRP